jgi:hypothetical protein
VNATTHFVANSFGRRLAGGRPGRARALAAAAASGVGVSAAVYRVLRGRPQPEKSTKKARRRSNARRT